MTRAKRFFDHTQFTVEIRGVEFVLRVLTPHLALSALGSRLFGVVAAHNAKGDVEVKEKDRKKMEEAGRKLLEACMVSPRLGPASAPDDDVIGYDDLKLSGFIPELSAAIQGSGGEVDDFADSCGDSTEGAPQDGSMPSDSDTACAPAS